MRMAFGVFMLWLAVLPARAAEAPDGCAWLCGKWVIDATSSEAPDAAVDTALQKFKEPKPRKPPRPRRGDLLDPDDPAFALPVPESPGKAALRQQLLTALEPPASLAFAEQARVIVIRAGDTEERRVYPGEPHSRVSAQGTTRISTDWKKTSLVVSEDRGGKRKTTETFALLPDGTLQLTRLVEYPGLKPMRHTAIYRRDQTQALESPAAGAPIK